MTFDKLKNNSGIKVRMKVYYTSPLAIKQSDTNLVDQLRLTPLAIKQSDTNLIDQLRLLG